MQVRVNSADGRLLHRIGRRGGGPGEFQGVPGFGIHGDTLWTYDLTAGRITLFDTRGTVLSTGTTHGKATVLSDGRRVWVTPSRMRDDGRFITCPAQWWTRRAGSQVRSRAWCRRPDTRTRSAPLQSAASPSMSLRPARSRWPSPGELGPITWQIRAAMEWPPFRQPYTSARLAEDGSLWLARNDAPGTPTTWFVVESDGTARGSITLPPRARVLWSRDDLVWAAVPDDLDVPWLVRFRLRG